MSKKKIILKTISLFITTFIVYLFISLFLWILFGGALSSKYSDDLLAEIAVSVGVVLLFFLQKSRMYLFQR